MARESAFGETEDRGQGTEVTRIVNVRSRGWDGGKSIEDRL